MPPIETLPPPAPQARTLGLIALRAYLLLAAAVVRVENRRLSRHLRAAQDRLRRARLKLQQHRRTPPGSSPASSGREQIGSPAGVTVGRPGKAKRRAARLRLSRPRPAAAPEPAV